MKLKLGDEWVSDNGHIVKVIGLGSDEVTFGFTRKTKNGEDRRERSVPITELRYFLKAYKPKET